MGGQSFVPDDQGFDPVLDDGVDGGEQDGAKEHRQEDEPSRNDGPKTRRGVDIFAFESHDGLLRNFDSGQL